jgi:mannose/fructose/N-acetylgalactosamine-specific phosphotransferase system component IIB
VQNLLFHIDSRRLHGQIVAGWGFPRQVKRFLLADDGVVADEWEREQYRNTPGAEFETEVMSVAESIVWLKAWTDRKRTLLVVNSPADALRILEAGIVHDLIRIGSLDPGPGKRQLSPSVSITEPDRQALLGIVQRNVRIVIQPLPGNRPIPVTELLIGSEQ